MTCNDNDACTNDSCNAASGCVNAANTAGCNDNNACTADACTKDGCTHTPTSGTKWAPRESTQASAT